jgi:hypothetical protein
MSAAVVLVGTLTGLHAATWGAFKDSPFEGFRTHKFARSVLLGVAAAYAVHRLTGISDLLVLIGLAYCAERLATEWWKAILREDHQGGYTIPMRLAVRGRPIDSRLTRYAVGLGILAGLLGVLALAAANREHLANLPAWQLVALAGVGGWLTAFGGAWKDAPIEGFETLKFFRSPVVATAWASALVPFTTDLPVLAIAAAGWSVITIETYKTFLDGGVPGKFGDKPARHPAQRVRRTCRALHCGLYAALTGGLALTVFAATLPGVEADPGQVRAELQVLLLSCGYAFVLLTTGGARRPAPGQLQEFG